MSTVSPSDIEAIAQRVAAIMGAGASVGSPVGTVEVVVGESSGFEDGAGTEKSWADEVSEESEGVVVENGPVQMPRGALASSAARAVRFGGISDVVGTVVVGPTVKGFYSSYVRSPNVLAYKAWLLKECDVKLPKQGLEELALVTYTPATVPDAFDRGPARIRSLASVGDAVLSFLLVARLHAAGQTVASLQAAKSSMLTNSVMSRSFVGAGLARFVAVPAGVSVVSSKVGADALEALFGVLANWRDMSAVVKVVNRLGLFESVAK